MNIQLTTDFIKAKKLLKINMPKININIDLHKKPKAKYNISKGRKGFAQLRKD